MSRPNCHLVLNSTSWGIPASSRRWRSFAQLSGRYRRQPKMVCPCSPTWCTLTATWQLPTRPNVPEYCRSTPTECSPCLGKPVSSITHTESGSNSAVIRLVFLGNFVSTNWSLWFGVSSAEQFGGFGVGANVFQQSACYIGDRCEHSSRN